PGRPAAGRVVRSAPCRAVRAPAGLRRAGRCRGGGRRPRRGGAGGPPPGPRPPPGAPPARPPPPRPPRPPAPPRYWIEINGNRHQISRPTLVLGRSTDADVRIDDPGVSRRHCEIRTGTPSTIQDLGSTNGIVVDGQHTTRATLRDGSRIVVGSTTVIYRQAEG
ncbi:FHA domain-containing protein, partial [Streptomyces mexicanus]|uniref:FHA domain-containing protein n=1 Tax=Streptomyces mexicanus TaxID=178566 RepID=UPI003F696535